MASVAAFQTPTSAGTSSGGPWPKPDLYRERYEMSVDKWPNGSVCLGDTVKFMVVVRKIGTYLVRRGPSKNVGSVAYDVDLGPQRVPVSVQYDSSDLHAVGQSANSGVFSFRAVASGWTTLEFSVTDSRGQTLTKESGVDVWRCDYRVLTMSTWYVQAEANVMAVSTMNTVLESKLVDPSHLELSNLHATVYNVAAYAIGRACPATEHMSSASTNVDGQVDLDAGTMWVYVPYPSVPVSTLVSCPHISGSNKLPDSGDPYPFKVTMDSVNGGVVDIPEPQLRVPGLGVSDGDTHVKITKLRPGP